MVGLSSSLRAANLELLISDCINALELLAVLCNLGVTSVAHAFGNDEALSALPSSCSEEKDISWLNFFS